MFSLMLLRQRPFLPFPQIFELWTVLLSGRSAFCQFGFLTLKWWHTRSCCCTCFLKGSNFRHNYTYRFYLSCQNCGGIIFSFWVTHIFCITEYFFYIAEPPELWYCCYHGQNIVILLRRYNEILLCWGWELPHLWNNCAEWNSSVQETSAENSTHCIKNHRPGATFPCWNLHH